MDLMRLSFSDGRIVEYSAEDADLIEHAYATTVHKSQGSEYKVVIIPWLPMFYMMLRRNILYTAITRAKEKIVIVAWILGNVTRIPRHELPQTLDFSDFFPLFT